MKSLSTSHLTGQDISSELSVHTWAADRDALVTARVRLSNLSASTFTRKLLLLIDGAFLGKTTLSDGSNPTALVFSYPGIPLKSGEQIDLRITGLPGDNSIEVESELLGTDALNALDAARPSSPVASSPLDDMHRARARLANTVTETVDTRVLSVKTDDGQSELFSMTPSESDGVITLTPA